MLVALWVGCASPSQRGDRAFKAKRYTEALNYYDQAIGAGEHDPQVFAHAARSALRLGDFSLAERYYSQALRNGAGEAIIRELAEFYIATSNYTKAVRVLQGLLEITDRPQTVFNNLGAALMYADSPLNAESYLMVAQQMNPRDPVPYVNLGVLYEKYLHKPRLALGFYQCFLKLSGKSRQLGKVKARVAALKLRYQSQMPTRFSVACGQPYQPAKQPDSDEVKRTLAESMQRFSDDSPSRSPEESAEQTSENTLETHANKIVKDPEHSTDSTGETAGPDGEDKTEKPVIIYRPDKPQPPADQQPGATQNSGLSEAQVLTLAEKAFAKHNYHEVIEQLEALPAGQLDVDAMALYGRSLAAIGDFEQARPWLIHAVSERPKPQTVAALQTVYRKLNESDKLEELCQRFGGKTRYRSVLTQCTDAQADPLEESAP